MRLRFSVRDLLWLTLVAALAAAWWLDPLNVFVVLPITASIPLGFLVGSRAHGRLRFKIVVAGVFAIGWIGVAIYLEALRVAFHSRSTGPLFERFATRHSSPDRNRCALPALGTSLLLWRTWARSANEAITTKSN